MLSPSQEEAVCHGSGPCLTLAGPGSGKTYVLTRRIQHLITKGGVPPEQILVITFTKAAALEMKERFIGLMGQEYPVVFGTFHSVFYGMLRREPGFRTYRLLDHKSKQAILKETAYVVKMSCAEDDLMHMEQEISYIKNTMVALAGYASPYFPNEKIIKLYEHYEARKEVYHLLDYDDLLVKTRELLYKDPSFLAKWQKRFSYLLLDEVQDMNALQFEIIRLLALPDNNLFAVGDDDQSIYGFRGARPDLMFSFENYYPGVKILQLRDNYRCKARILQASLALISHNEIRFTKEILGQKEGKGNLEVVSLADKKAETAYLVQILKHQRTGGKNWEDMAVLYRNHAQIGSVIEALQDEKIPFYVKDAVPNPYKHFVMLDLIAYLRLGSPLLHRPDLFRIMNRPDRFLQRASVTREWTTFEAWKHFYQDQPGMQRTIEKLEGDINFLRSLSGPAAITFICKRLGYEAFLKKQARDDAEYQKWQESIGLLKETAKNAKTTGQIIEQWEIERDAIDRINQEKSLDKEGKVGLYTLHGAKGLEFDTVFILDCNETILPSKKADSREKIEEERRLFYVGMTRAKENLYLLAIRQEQGKKMHPSRFLKEIEKVQT